MGFWVLVEEEERHSILEEGIAQQLKAFIGDVLLARLGSQGLQHIHHVGLPANCPHTHSAQSWGWGRGGGGRDAQQRIKAIVRTTHIYTVLGCRYVAHTPTQHTCLALGGGKVGGRGWRGGGVHVTGTGWSGAHIVASAD